MTADSNLILVVEDEPAILSLLTDILSHRAGYPVITAMCGNEAVEIYGKRATEISLVILDMNMPGMNGIETFYELMKMNPSVRVLISTGYTRNEKIKQLLQDGVKGFVQKPYHIGELLKLVQDVIRPGQDD